MILPTQQSSIGRGWSPIAWDILKGSEKIFVSLLNINEKIDMEKSTKKNVSILMEQIK